MTFTNSHLSTRALYISFHVRFSYFFWHFCI